VPFGPCHGGPDLAYDPTVKLTIIGASGRIGRHVLDQALASGHDVTVLVRDPRRLSVDARRLRIVTGTVEDGEAVDRAVAGADAVISAVGPDGNAPDQVDRLRSGMRLTVEAMRRHGVRRIVILSGAGITGTGEHKPFLDRVATRIVRTFSRHVVAAKQAEYDALAGTDLEWVAVRPALVTDGPRTGRYAAGPNELRPGARTSRADVAHLMLAQAERPTHIGHPGLFVRAL
jgi:putative NADH-flavin reductase